MMNSRPILIEAEKIYKSFDPPTAVEAVLVENGCVVRAGSRTELRRDAPANVEIVELPGAVVIPGLVESHIHTVFTGMIHQWADLRPEAVADIDELCSAIERHGPLFGWFRGWGYDDTMLADQRHPDRHDLDRISTEIPILITHISGHFAVANTRALEIAGITDSTPDPDGGRFIRDGDGHATGLLWEVGAVRLVRDQCPPPTKEDGLRAAAETMNQAVRRGITQIHDLGIGSQLAEVELELLRDLDRGGEMPVRMFGYLRGDLAAAALDADPAVFSEQVDRSLVIRGVKLWADGSIQGLSASVVESYHCCPDSHGDLLLTGDAIVERARPLVEAGAQVAVHANGDNAIAQVIDAYRRLPRVSSSSGDAGLGHRIEHFQMAHPDHVETCAELDIAVSVFANHVRYWGDRHRDRFIGPERAERLNPLRECVEHGLRTGVHSDSPITPMDVLATLDTAVSRLTRDGAVLGGSQAITPVQALHLATAGSAALVGAERSVGRLVPGQAADLTVLDRDPLGEGRTGSGPAVRPPSGGPESSPFAGLSVHATMVGGRWVHGF